MCLVTTAAQQRGPNAARIIVQGLGRAIQRPLQVALLQCLLAQLARIVGYPDAPGCTINAYQPSTDFNGLFPFPDLLVHVGQMATDLLLVQSFGQHAREQLLGAIQQACFQKVAPQFQARLGAQILAQGRAPHHILVHAYGPIDFSPAAEQTPQREVQLDRVGVYCKHLDQHFGGFVGLFVEQVIQPLTVGRVQRRPGTGNGLPVTVAGRPPTGGSRHRQQQPEQDLCVDGETSSTA